MDKEVDSTGAMIPIKLTNLRPLLLSSPPGSIVCIILILIIL